MVILWWTIDVSHLTCWCWAVPDPAIGQRPLGLRGLLGFHGWRSCGQTVVRRWSPHRSPPHPSSLTHLTIAGPARPTTAALRRTLEWPCATFYFRQWLKTKRVPRRAAHTHLSARWLVCKPVVTWRKWHSDTHGSALLYPDDLIPD